MAKYIVGLGIHHANTYHAYGILSAEEKAPLEESDAFAVFGHIDRHVTEHSIAERCELDPTHESPGCPPHTQIRIVRPRTEAVSAITLQITAKLEALGHVAIQDERIYRIYPEAGVQIGMFFDGSSPR